MKPAALAAALAPPPRLCDDFDSGPLGAVWSGQSVVTDGALALDPTTSTSAPDALRATVPSAGPNGSQTNTSELVQQMTTGTFTLTPTTVPLQLAHWTHVRLDLDLSSSPGSAMLAFDGATVATVTLAPEVVAAPPRFEAGLAWSESSTAVWRVDLDNVVLAF